MPYSLKASSIRSCERRSITPRAKIDLSRADTGELQQIPGIGDTHAQELISWRDEHGPFHGWEDVDQIPAFSSGKLDNIKSHATIGESG